MDRLTARNLNENLENNLQLEFSPCLPCVPWIFLVAYGKKSLEEIFFKMLLRKKYFRDLQIISLTKSLTKISAKNAQQYVAFGEDLYWDRLTARNLNENFKKNL